MNLKTIINSIFFLISFLVVYSIFGFITLATDIWLVFFVYLIAFSTFNISLGFALTISYLLSFFSTAPFGTHFFIYLSILLIIYYLSQNVLTHQSLSSFLLLNAIALASFYILTFALSYLYLLVGIQTYMQPSLTTIIIQTILNLALAVSIFMSTTYFGNKLRLNILQNTKL